MCEFFAGFFAIYQNMAHLSICCELKLETLTQEQKTFWVSKYLSSPHGFK